MLGRQASNELFIKEEGRELKSLREVYEVAHYVKSECKSEITEIAHYGKSLIAIL